MSASLQDMTCETCQHWDRQPDKVFQPTHWQKPVGEPIITVSGICGKLNLSCSDPPEDGISYDASHCSDYGDEARTGPKFGCIFHETRQCSHTPIWQDLSFDHEFGTEKGGNWVCSKCGEVVEEPE